jgi:chitinase
VTEVLSSHVSPIYTNAVKISKSKKSQQNTSKFKMKIWAFTVFSLLLSLLLGGSAEQCGSQAGGALCPGGLCCSQFGWCGSTNDYCGTGCQSQCGGAGGGDLGSIISSAKFDEMLKHRNDGGCPGKGFYTYNAFISAANAFSGFGTTGDADTRKREIAAFLGQTSHETTGSFNQSQT